ncbi:hypothetical protein [Sphaerisporangium dianthi]|uniref:Uncharacterized protein n=1 Tax=Sphaerisporangium dianthi TaxID=1436120 RepID=A0ABV9CNU6_9ACTN
MIKPSIAVTRVVNSCVPLEPDGKAAPTDPWFTDGTASDAARPAGPDLLVRDLPAGERWESPC